MPFSFDAVIFDFDGVIVDSEPVHCRAYLETSATMGVPLTRGRYYRELIGMDDRGAVEHLYRVADLKFDETIYRRFLTDKSSRVLRMLSDGTLQPLPGVKALLTHLSERNCAIGIYSAALRRELETMLRGVRLEKYFQIVTAAEDVQVSKPDPSGYVLTARHLSETIRRPLLVERCLVIE